MSGVDLMDLIPSLNELQRVEAFGFEQADDAAHMICWLGRGSNFRQFVTNDVEGELYAQTPGAQLLSITCKKPPHIKTKLTPRNQIKIPTDINISFLISSLIKMPDCALWKLDVDNNYDAKDIHLKDNRIILTHNFLVLGHERIS